MAGIGPFTSFSFPDVYTETLNEAPRVTAAGGLRFPAFIGVADETVRISNFEMVRGSSSIADNPIVKEDVSSQLDGTNRNFTVTFFPIVDGTGSGTVTNNPNNVTAYANGKAVPVASVDGATGEIYLLNIPRDDDEILISYYYKRTDTLITEEDQSDQADGSNLNFKVDNTPIVQGDNGGITTTDPSNVTVTVNNVAAVVSAVDGDSGIITLASAPTSGQEVLITYYTNILQDTADILPSPVVTDLLSVGLAPGTVDFVENTDYVLDTTGNFYTVNWGHSYNVASGQHTVATELFDDSQISMTLFDNRVWKREATSGDSDGTNATFGIEAIPTTGQGLGKTTDNPSLITAYVGTSAVDATAVDVVAISGAGRTVTLQTPPTADSTVYVTQYQNLLPDDAWTLEVVTAGATGAGEYSLSGENTGIGMDILWSTADTTVADPDFAAENVTYPNGTGAGSSDGQVYPGYAVEEVISLTFADSSSYIVTSSVATGTGSAGDNTGYLNQTYIDAKTGFRVTINEGTLVTYTAGDVIGYTSSPTFITSATPTRAIPGARMFVSDTADIGVGDTALVNTYNKSGAEPDIGDFYYVTFDEAKTTFNEALFFTQEQAALAFTGPLSQSNTLGLAAHLAFLNGTVAVALMQLQRGTGSSDAPNSAYITGIDYFDEPMEGGARPSLMQPVTTSSAVLSYLRTSNVQQSGIRFQNERMTYFGFPLNTSPATAQTYAKSMKSERMIGIYPDGAITTITDELGNDIEYLMDGALLAAAISGRDTSPAFDVAEPMTRKPIVGFTRLFRRMDSVTSAQTANSGLTIIEEQAAGMRIKIALTTDLASVLTRTPSVIRIRDFVQKGTRSILDTFIGSKQLASRTNEITTTLGSYFKALKQGSIITGYTGLKATVDENDPTIIRVEGFYSPVLPLLWIVVRYNLRTSV